MSLRLILKQQNQHLLRDVTLLIQNINQAKIISELIPYVSQVISVCEETKNTIDNNLSDLELNTDSILDDILSNTQQVTQIVRLLSARMTTPILRCSERDKLGIKVINWLHNQHRTTSGFPAVFADGDCAIWPFIGICPMYFFPVIEQRVLLYLPLYLHEFGHLLYRIHERELNDLVQELQREADDILRPPSQRDDSHAAWQNTQREHVVTAWYKWMQELFCDAVGLAIGGPAFLQAFSTYLCTFDRGDFYSTASELSQSDHPISLLRIRLLSSRAQDLGIGEISSDIMSEWCIIADAMGVSEDYYGFYDENLSSVVQNTIDDMITEVDPRIFHSDEIKSKYTETVNTNDSPIQIVHKAWDAFSTLSEREYSNWESEAITSWLS